MSALAHAAVAACGADACIIAWSSTDARGIVRLPAGRRWAAALDAIQAAVERRMEAKAGVTAAAVHLDAAESARLIGAAAVDGRRCDVFAHSATDGAKRVTLIVATPGPREKSELDALTGLIASDAMRIMAEHEAAASRDFWRKRALEVGERLTQTKALLNEKDAAHSLVDDAVAAALKLRPRNRFARLAAIFARIGPFDGWIVALTDGDELRAVAASAAAAPIPPLNEHSALVECLQRKTIVLRQMPMTRTAMTYYEDRLLAHYSSYLCAPFDVGAIALASRRPIESAAVERTESLAGRLTPLIRSWLVEAEVERSRQLIASLGLRMFGAVDNERARIARDLHDHQAQLLAAGRIALEAGPDEARGIFKQLEEALRLRVRELRPARLGRTSLEEALRYELRRLADAGIKGRLLRSDRMNRVTRPVQQLCYQVAREALSNVVRHSGATRVTIAVEKHRGGVRMTIADNGKGIPGNGAGDGSGMGLSGLRERLELMGGRLRIETRPGSTSLIAEVPEPV